jgi:glucosamine--fructose-6-phosphate aminotransferase (isomerizing)
MFREAAESSELVRRQHERNREIVGSLAERLRDAPPRAIVTLARGSSDHAATFARYLIETRAGVLTTSISPSVGSIYQAMPDLQGAAVLAISQSGRSPDLIAAAEQTRAQGALLIALVNDEQSPLADMADVLIPLAAGPERSVAATKSFIASLAALVDLLAAWIGDAAMQAALDALPGQLEQAWALGWSAAVPALESATTMYVVGRGPGLGVAQEAALKLKETCGLHAEAFSAAEVRHGPMALVDRGFPVLLFGQSDESVDSVAELAREFEQRGAHVLSAGVPGAGGTVLPVPASDAVTAPILRIASFYRLANALALTRGLDPDRPPHLTKVTETI